MVLVPQALLVPILEVEAPIASSSSSFSSLAAQMA